MYNNVYSDIYIKLYTYKVIELNDHYELNAFSQINNFFLSVRISMYVLTTVCLCLGLTVLNIDDRFMDYFYKYYSNINI